MEIYSPVELEFDFPTHYRGNGIPQFTSIVNFGPI